MLIKKYDLLLVDLNPTKGSEQKGVRPCLVLQNNAANAFSGTTVVCPISTTIKHYPHTLIVEASKKNGLKAQSRVDILQLRVIDKKRILKKLGELDEKYREELKHRIGISFDLDDIL